MLLPGLWLPGRSVRWSVRYELTTSLQLLAIAVEATRLSLIEILLSGAGLSPLA